MVPATIPVTLVSTAPIHYHAEGNTGIQTELHSLPLDIWEASVSQYNQKLNSQDGPALKTGNNMANEKFIKLQTPKK